MNFTARQSEVIRFADRVLSVHTSEADAQMEAAQAVLGLIFSAEDSAKLVEWADETGEHILEAVRAGLEAKQVRLLGHDGGSGRCEAAHEDELKNGIPWKEDF